MNTHKQLVEKWKENFSSLDDHEKFHIADNGFLDKAMMAAATGAAEAGMVEMKDEHPMEGDVPVETYGYEAEYNSAISQSQRQIAAYFEEI